MVYQSEYTTMHAVEIKAEEVTSNDKIAMGPLDIHEDKFVLTTEGGEEKEFKFPKARKVAEWIAKNQSKFGELSPESAMLEFVLRHFEAMGEAGKTEAEALSRQLEQDYGSDYRIGVTEKWDNAHELDLGKLYLETGLEKPEAEEEE